MGTVRAAVRDAHRKRLREHDHPVTVRLGGPTLDEKGRMNGSLLVIEAASRADVEAFLSGDPYVEAGLYDRTEIRPWNWGLGKPEEVS
jgi:hypothetical protein